MKAKKKNQMPSRPFQNWLAEFEMKHGVGFEHGDYQRIAKLTTKADGTPFTSDYVRKVTLGIRANPMIYRKAQEYLKGKVKLIKPLGSAS